jgi:hypothetical protein
LIWLPEISCLVCGYMYITTPPGVNHSTLQAGVLRKGRTVSVNEIQNLFVCLNVLRKGRTVSVNEIQNFYENV